jgi:hypothetical protein
MVQHRPCDRVYLAEKQRVMSSLGEPYLDAAYAREQANRF